MENINTTRRTISMTEHKQEYIIIRKIDKGRVVTRDIIRISQKVQAKARKKHAVKIKGTIETSKIKDSKKQSRKRKKTSQNGKAEYDGNNDVQGECEKLQIHV